MTRLLGVWGTYMVCPDSTLLFYSNILAPNICPTKFKINVLLVYLKDFTTVQTHSFKQGFKQIVQILDFATVFTLNGFHFHLYNPSFPFNSG